MPDWRAIVRARLSTASPHPPDDVVDELAQHAEMLFLRLSGEGMADTAALAAVEEELRDGRPLTRAARSRTSRRLALPETPPPGRLQSLGAFAKDLVYATRLMAARPGFTAVAVFTLALGVGANTAIFSVVNTLMLAPLPFHEPERLVMIWESDANTPGSIFIVSRPNWEDWRARSTTLQDFAIWEFLSFNLSGGPEPEQVSGLRMSSSTFDLLGVKPQLGRAFTAEEDQPGHRVVVISDALWASRFGRRRDVIGQTMRVNGEPYEIVGVMPPRFRFVQARHALWVPIQFTSQDGERSAHSFNAAARLQSGVTLEAARSELAGLSRAAVEGSDDNRDHRAVPTAMADLGVAPLGPTLVALVGAVGFVLLIACVNVANLMLAQAAGRQREFAIRSALGAARGRLASQLFAEGLLLAIAGGMAGVLLAWIGTTAMAGSLPPAIQSAPFRDTSTVPLDGRVLAFTAAVALLTGILFSLAPMFGAARTQPGATLKAAGDRGGTARLVWLRHALVASEISLAVVVLFGAGLMIKSVARLVAVDPGLASDNVLLMDIALPQADTYGPPERTTFCDDLQREVGSLPGVRAVGAMSHLPLTGANAGRALTIEGRPVPPPPTRGQRELPPDLSRLLRGARHPRPAGPRLHVGRQRGGRCRSDHQRGVGTTVFNGQDPIGQRMKLGRPQSMTPWMTIVGVVRDVRHFGLDNPVRREIYRPYSQAVWPSMTVAVSTAGEPLSLGAAVKAALARIDPEQPVSRIRSMESVVAESIGGRRFPALLLALFSAVALALAGIGVYGVVSYVVSQRTREMGIRIALGAGRRQVVALVVGGSLRPVAGGVVLGIAGAILAARLLTTLLYEVRAYDPAVMAGIVAILAATAAVAGWIPARRAASVDPLVALRDE